MGEAYVDIRSRTDQFEKDATSSITSFAKKAAGILATSFVIKEVGQFVASTLRAADEAQKVTAQTAAVVKSTGGLANVSAQQVGNMADRLSKLTGVEDETIQRGENMLLTFTNIRNEVGKGNDIFNQATTSVLDMSVALGEDTQGAAIQLGKALQDPVKGVTALRRVGVMLTDQQQAQVKTMVEQGNIMGAQKIILKELTTEFGGSAQAQATAASRMAASWDQFKETVGGALMPVVDTFTDKFLPMLETLGSKAGGFVAPLADKLAPVLGAILDVVYKLVDTAGPPLLSMLVSMTPLFLSLAQASLKIVDGLAPILRLFTQIVNAGVVYALTPLVDAFSDLLTTLGPSLPLVLGLGLAWKYLGSAIGGIQKLAINLVPMLGSWGIALGLVAGAVLLLGDNLGDQEKKAEAAGKTFAQNMVAQAQAAGMTIPQIIAMLEQEKQKVLDNLAAHHGNTQELMDRGKQLEALQGQIGSLNATQQAQTQVTAYQTEQQKKANDAITQAVLAGNQKHALELLLAQDEQKLTQAQTALTAAQQAATAALQANVTQTLSAMQSEDSYYSALQQATDAAVRNGNTLDVHTVKGLANRQMLDQLSAAVYAQINAMVAQGATTQQIDGVLDQHRTEMEKLGAKYGLTKEQVDAYLDAVKLTPGSVNTALETSGYTTAVNQLSDIARLIDAIKNGNVYVDPTGKVWYQHGTGPGAYWTPQGAASGFVTRGPQIIQVGEGRSQYPEFVIPSDPRYRKNALGLLSQAFKVIGMAAGGAWTPTIAYTGAAMPRGASVYGGGIPADISTYTDIGRLMTGYMGQWRSALIEQAKQAWARALEGVAGSVTQWVGVATQVANMLGQPNAVAALLRRIQLESGGNPLAVNRWDSNWAAGHPSVGLMQVIAGTFAAYAGKYAGTGPFLYGVSVNPWANVFAGANYATRRYGSIAAVDPRLRPGGYDLGGFWPTGTAGVNTSGMTEAVIPLPAGVLEGLRAIGKGLGGGMTFVIDARGSDSKSFEAVMRRVAQEEIVPALSRVRGQIRVGAATQ